jgi:hypothetical protein
MNEADSLNPVVLVSGASSGIGAAICRLLVARQFRIVAAARNQDRLQQLAAELGEALYPLVLDVTDSAAVSNVQQALPGNASATHSSRPRLFMTVSSNVCSRRMSPRRFYTHCSNPGMSRSRNWWYCRFPDRVLPGQILVSQDKRLG